MARHIEFQEDKLIVHLSGLTSTAALKRTVEVPYASIKHVSVANASIPLLTFRVGTSISDIREGHFLLDGQWCFVSYENHEHVLVLELAGHEYGKVIVQVENPHEAERYIQQRSRIG